jgi:hypothetical protein
MEHGTSARRRLLGRGRRNGRDSDVAQLSFEFFRVESGASLRPVGGSNLEEAITGPVVHGANHVGELRRIDALAPGSEQVVALADDPSHRSLELVWADSDGLSNFDYPATLWSCLADSCDATRRKLGYVVGGLRRVPVTADDTDLYWLEAGPNPTYPQNGSQSLINGQIRRAPRLSPGQP